MTNTTYIAFDAAFRSAFGRLPAASETRRLQNAVAARYDAQIAPPIGGSMDGPRWVSQLVHAGLVVCARERAIEQGRSRSMPMGGYVASAKLAALLS